MQPPVNLTGANQQIATAAPILRYRGFTVRETSGAASALIRIFDGTSAAGTVLEEIGLTANQTARENYSLECAIPATVGIYVQVVSGSVSGSVRFD